MNQSAKQPLCNRLKTPLYETLSDLKFYAHKALFSLYQIRINCAYNLRMNYEELIVESLNQLKELEKRQKLARDEKRIRFYDYSKAAKQKRKPQRASKSAGNYGSHKRCGHFIGSED